MYSCALPTDTPSPIFFWGKGTAVKRLSGTDNPVLKLSVEIDVRRIVHSKWKLFYFQIKKYYLSDANHRTDNTSHTTNTSLVWKRPFLLQWMSGPGISLDVRAFAFAFSQKLFFKLTINRNWKKLTNSRKRAKILADNRKSQHPIETLLGWLWFRRQTFHARI